MGSGDRRRPASRGRRSIRCAPGVGADKPLVLGATDDEFTMVTDGAKDKLRFMPASLALGKLGLDAAPRRKAYLAANGPQRRKGTAAVLGRFVTDSVFRVGVVRIAEARAAMRADLGVPLLVAVADASAGRCHCLDVPFWFDCLDADGVDGDRRRRTRRARSRTRVHGCRGRVRPRRRPGLAGLVGRRRAPRACSAATASPPDVDADGYASVRAAGLSRESARACRSGGAVTEGDPGPGFDAPVVASPQLSRRPRRAASAARMTAIASGFVVDEHGVAAERRRDRAGRAAAREEVEHPIARPARRLDDPAQDALGLLRRVAGLLATGRRHDRVPPHVGGQLAALGLLGRDEPRRHVRLAVDGLRVEPVRAPDP